MFRQESKFSETLFSHKGCQCSHNSATWLENEGLKPINRSLVSLVALLFTPQQELNSLSNLLTEVLWSIGGMSDSCPRGPAFDPTSGHFTSVVVRTGR